MSQAQQVLVTVNNLIQKLDDNMEKYDQKIERLQLKIKLYVETKQKKKAVRCLQEVKDYQQLLATIENQRLVFTQLQINLEMADETSDLLSVVKNTNQYLKSQEQVKEDLQDQLLDFQQYMQSKEETDQIWQQIADQGVDKDEIEDEYAKYEAQVLQGQMDKLPNANINNNNMEKQKQEEQLKQQQLQQNYQPKLITTNQMENALEDMLN